MERPVLVLILSCVLARGAEERAGREYHENYEPSPYHYEYKVHDDKEYLDFGHQEEGDGKGDVKGHYHVQLPDGRLQHVTYHVDDYSGYIADVNYDGHAEHPSYHGGHHGGYHGHGGHRLGKTIDHGHDLVSSNTDISVASSVSPREGKVLVTENSDFTQQKRPVVSTAAPFQSSFGSSNGFNSRFGASSNPFPVRKQEHNFGQHAPLKSVEPKETVVEEPSNEILESKPSFKPFPKENRPQPKPFTNFGSFPKHSFGSSRRPFHQPSSQGFTQTPSKSSLVTQTPHAFPTKPLNVAPTVTKASSVFSKKRLDAFPVTTSPSAKTPLKLDDENLHRHGKSGRPVVENEKSTNSFFKDKKASGSNFDSFSPIFGKSSRKQFTNEKPKQFDTFSPLFGKTSKSSDASQKKHDSFDSFSPIFGKSGATKSFSAKVKTVERKDDSSFSTPRESHSPVQHSQSFKSKNSGFPSERRQVFPPRQHTTHEEHVAHRAPHKEFPVSNEVSQSKHEQPSPRFKPRPIGFGDNHPVLQSLKKKESVLNGSVAGDSSFGSQGSFRPHTNRQQFGRALDQESTVHKSSNVESSNKSHRVLITHKAVPV